MRKILEYADLHTNYLKGASTQEGLNKLLIAILSRVNNDAMVYTIGNGGSLTTAEHFAADLNLTLKRVGKKVKSFCLGMQVASLTALSNDFSYDVALQYLLENYLKAGDLLVAFSVSGNSLNIVNSVKYADNLGIEVFTFSGFDGGEVNKLSRDQGINIPTPEGEYGIVENIHLMMCHYLIDSLNETFMQ